MARRMCKELCPILVGGGMSRNLEIVYEGNTVRLDISVAKETAESLDVPDPRACKNWKVGCDLYSRLGVLVNSGKKFGSMALGCEHLRRDIKFEFDSREKCSDFCPLAKTVDGKRIVTSTRSHQSLDTGRQVVTQFRGGIVELSTPVGVRLMEVNFRQDGDTGDYDLMRVDPLVNIKCRVGCKLREVLISDSRWGGYGTGSVICPYVKTKLLYYSSVPYAYSAINLRR